MGKTVLFVYHFLFNPYFGGIERVTDQIAKALIQKGYNVLYLGLKKRDEEMGYDFPCPFFFFPEEDDFSEKNRLFYLQFLRTHGVDVIINQAGAFMASHLFLNVGSNVGVKRISVIHSSPLLYYHSFASIFLTTSKASLKERLLLIKKYVSYFSYKKRTLKRFKRHYKFVGENSETVCLLSDRFREELRFVDFSYFSKIVAIPNPNSFKVDRLYNDKEKIILFVGRLDKGEKRPDRLLKVWRQLYKYFPDWKLLFVGDGEEREVLEKKVKTLSIERVFFEGMQHPIPYYEKAAIFCLTSNYEGFPVALTEAMQYGVVPIVFESFLSARDIIIPEETGILVKPFVIRDYVRELKNLMLDEEKRKRISFNVVNYVRQFDIDIIIKKWVSLIDGD